MTSQYLTLNTGAKIPQLGLGCWMGAPGERGGENVECYDMVMAALKMGYRHLDTAYGYGNENAVGKAIRDSGIPRSKIFLTTKLTNSDHARVKEGFETSLKALGVDYIDLFLIHWPQASTPDPKDPTNAFAGKNVPYGEFPTPVDTWKEMEKLDKKLCRAIGVSNFSPKILDELAAASSTVPAVNQVESHIYLPQESLTAYCKSKGIVLTAYSPLGQPRPGYPSPVLVDETAKKVAEKYGKPVGTILLSWLLQRGWTTVPKSANPDRLKANMDIVKLEQADFDALGAAHKGNLQRLCIGQDQVQEKGEIMGWSLKDMGWEKLD